MHSCWLDKLRAPIKGRRGCKKLPTPCGEGADAYLFRQFRVVGVLIVLITVALYFAAQSSGSPPEIAWGRAIAFLVGSTFSAMVGFVGMRLATIGNLRVAAAARDSFGSGVTTWL